MTNEKMIIQANGKELLLGAHFHTLEDKTQTTFETEHLDEFARYMEDKDESLLVMCQETKITAQAANPDRYTKPVAVCTLNHSQALKGLLEMANKKVTMAEFTEFLESYKKYTSAVGLGLLDNLRNFRMKKVLDVQSSKDNRGNFSYRVALESGGNDDFKPPESLVFGVPVWARVKEDFNHTFELQFSVIGSNDKPTLSFCLKTFDIEDRLQERKKEIVDLALATSKQQRLWGAQNVHRQDDAWRYFSNPVPEGQANLNQIAANNAYRGRG